MTEAYMEAGARRAERLGNRGPLELDGNGRPRPEILDAYWEHGFYVFEGVVTGEELATLIAEFEQVMARAPTASDAATDAAGRPAIGLEFARPSFRFAKPLSDPHGGTGSTHGRYPARMSEPAAPDGAPQEVVLQVSGILQLMESGLRLYGHPGLLAVAEAVNGPDFVPFTDTIWVKQAGLGPSVAWHQDGTTHWNDPRLDAGTHGFNFMTQLYRTTPENALWVVPGTHDQGRIDIRTLMEANGGSDRLPDAVPMLGNPGDVAICNRQVLHGSFANASPDLRATFVFGFHRRNSILGVNGWAEAPYDADRVHARSRLIALAVDARHLEYPAERTYVYQPLAAELDANRYDARTRRSVLRNYNLNDLGI